MTQTKTKAPTKVKKQVEKSAETVTISLNSLEAFQTQQKNVNVLVEVTHQGLVANAVEDTKVKNLVLASLESVVLKVDKIHFINEFLKNVVLRIFSKLNIKLLILRILILHVLTILLS